MEKISFIVTGDWGLDTTLYRINRSNMLKQNNINFYILLGDNFYPSGVVNINDPQWLLIYKKTFLSSIPCFPILGNHDYVLNPQAQILYSSYDSSWRMPFYYYDMIINMKNNQTVHFIFLDTCLLADDITLSLIDNSIHFSSISNYKQLVSSYQNKQKEWLLRILKNSTSKWKIVCGHYPIYSNGPHVISNKLQTFLSPLFQQYNVDFYLSGHDHNIQHILKNKTNYIISGGFCNFQPVWTPYIQKGSRYISNMGGFLRFDIKNNNIIITFIGMNNHIQYTYSYNKC